MKLRYVSIKCIIRIFQSPSSAVASENTPKLQGDIVFDNVHFKYASRDVEVLKVDTLLSLPQLSSKLFPENTSPQFSH